MTEKEKNAQSAKAIEAKLNDNSTPTQFKQKGLRNVLWQDKSTEVGNGTFDIQNYYYRIKPEVKVDPWDKWEKATWALEKVSKDRIIINYISDIYIGLEKDIGFKRKNVGYLDEQYIPLNHLFEEIKDEH